jgi:hypothetical protein
MVNVPPSCGVPRLSHQFPVEVVVMALVTTDVDVVDVWMVPVAVDVVVIVVVVVGDKFVVVDVEQDANTSDITIRMVSAIQITPLFI